MSIDREAMENNPAPTMIEIPGMPTAATAEDLSRLRDPDLMPRSIRSVQEIASKYTGGCVCGHTYANNCAHYLTQAIIAAGFDELGRPSQYINARCAQKRPIRAREMREWFNSIATKRTTTLARNTGWWAFFQLDESAYWGGHVCIVDTDRWSWYGTGFFPEWEQYGFRW